MKNIYSQTLRSQSKRTILRHEPNNAQVISYEGIIAEHAVMRAQRNERRKKPELLSVAASTASEIESYVYTSGVGAIGAIGDAVPYGPRYYREFTGGSYDTPWSFGNEANSLIDMNSLDKPLQAKALAEIIEGRSQFTVDVLELGKNRLMLAKAGKDLLNFYRDLRRGRPLGFLKEAYEAGYKNYAGRKWLEFIYGWSPTVASVYDYTEKLSHSFRYGKTCTGTVKGFNSVEKRAIKSFGTYDLTTALHGQVRYEFKISDPKLAELADLGITNPLAIAWELAPSSFVFDWLGDFGGYLNRIDACLGLSDVVSSYSAQRIGINNITFNKGPGVAPWSLNAPFHAICVSRTAKRTTARNGLTNSFRGFKKPWGGPTEKARLATTLALIEQFRSKR